MSGIGHYLGPLAHLAGGAFEMAHHAGKFAGPVGNRVAGAVPWLGAGINAWETGAGIARAQNGADAGNVRERDRGIGDAAWGGLGVAASFCPPAAMAHGAISLTNELVAGQSFGASIADFGHEVSDWWND